MNILDNGSMARIYSLGIGVRFVKKYGGALVKPWDITVQVYVYASISIKTYIDYEGE